MRHLSWNVVEADRGWMTNFECQIAARLYNLYVVRFGRCTVGCHGNRRAKNHCREKYRPDDSLKLTHITPFLYSGLSAVQESYLLFSGRRREFFHLPFVSYQCLLLARLCR